jgi:Flp pilus assembly protein TadD
LRQSPDDTDALKTSALLFLGKKDYEGAATAYRKLIELQPDSFSYHTALGLVLEDQGNLELALREYRVALALNPSDHWTSEEYNSVLRKIDEHSDRR